MEQRLLPGTQIEIVNENIERGRLKHLLFDFDGTISILREGWPEIMAPACVEMVCGDTEPTQAIIDEVNKMIDDTTGIQTIYQMECLQEMVIAHGLVPKEKVLSPAEYKQTYLDRLMVPVRARIARLEAGEKTVTDFTDCHYYWYSWEWKPDDRRFNNRSLMTEENTDLCTPAAFRVLDMPFHLSEWDDPWPNEH